MAKISRWLPLTALAGVAIGGGLWLGLAGPSEKPAALPATADAPLPGGTTDAQIAGSLADDIKRAALLQRPGAILSRAQLMDRGWDSDADSADRTVDTHVKTLRAKLRAAGADPDPIRTHRGLGYAIEA